MARWKYQTGGFLLRFKKELNLSESQVEKLKEYSLNACKKLHSVKEDIVKEKSKLNNLAAQKDINIDAYKRQLKRVYDMEYSFKCRAIEEFQKAGSVLSPEQKAKLPKLLKNWVKHK